MKYLLSASGFFILIIFAVTQGVTKGCNNQQPLCDSVAEVLSDKILTSHTWITRELRAAYGDEPIYYLRGGADNSMNFDQEYFVFYTNGTGLSIDANGYSHKIKDWKFVNENNTKLTFKYFITNSSIYQEMTWDNILYKNKTIINEEYWHDNYVNKNYHGRSVRFIK